MRTTREIIDDILASFRCQALTSSVAQFKNGRDKYFVQLFAQIRTLKQKKDKMAEPIESGECDVCADAQFTDNGFNGANQLFADTERHANVLGLIGNYPLEDAQRYIILEAGIDKQRFVTIFSSSVNLAHLNVEY